MAAASPQYPVRPFLVVALTALFGVALTIATGIWFWHEAQHVDQARFDRLAQTLTEELDFRTEKIEALLSGLQRTLAAHPQPELVDWDEYVNQASPQWNFPGLAALGYATNHQIHDLLTRIDPWLLDQPTRSRQDFYSLPPELPQQRQWSAWLIDIYREGMAPFAASTNDSIATNELKNLPLRFFPGQHLKFTQSAFLQRVDGNFFGLNEYPTALEDAITRDEIKVTAREPLLRHRNGTILDAVTMVAPVAHPARRRAWLKLTPGADVAEAKWLRWQFNAGLVFAYLDFAAMLKDIQGETVPEVEVEIYCSAEGKPKPAPETWLNSASGRMRAAGAGSKPSLTRLNYWAMYGTRWNLFFYTTPQFDRVSTRFRAFWASAFGLFGTALICALLAVQIRARLTEQRRALELKEARSALQAAQRHRERLSHDLHDGAIQSIYAVQLGLTGVERELEQIKPGTGSRLSEARSALDLIIGELRNFILEMQDDRTPSRTGSLVGVLQSLVRRLHASSGAEIDLECDPAASDLLTSRQAVQLGAIAREALSNSMRHARATQMKVRLAFEANLVRLEISDNGCGFNLESVNGRGLGINSMRRRAQELNARLEIHSSPAAGTRVTCGLTGGRRVEPAS